MRSEEARAVPTRGTADAVRACRPCINYVCMWARGRRRQGVMSFLAFFLVCTSGRQASGRKKKKEIYIKKRDKSNLNGEDAYESIL